MLRFQFIDEALQHGRKVSFQNLLTSVNQKLEDIGTLPIKKRQLHYDLDTMQETSAFCAPIEKIKQGKESVYFYSDKNFSIWKSPIGADKIREDINDALHLLKTNTQFLQFVEFSPAVENLEKLFNQNIEHSNFVQYQQNMDLKGLEYFKPIYDAISKRQVLKLMYKPFGKKEERMIVHPYFLKQYNFRWFLIGFSELHEKLSNFALDRIEQLTQSSHIFQPSNINMLEYFEDCLGVTKQNGAMFEEIVLWVKKNRYNYIQTKPIHPSQKELKSTIAKSPYQNQVHNLPDGVLIQLDLIVNRELIAELQSFGGDIIVLQPSHLQQEIINKINEQTKLYQSITDQKRATKTNA